MPHFRVAEAAKAGKKLHKAGKKAPKRSYADILKSLSKKAIIMPKGKKKGK